MILILIILVDTIHELYQLAGKNYRQELSKHPARTVSHIPRLSHGVSPGHALTCHAAGMLIAIGSGLAAWWWGGMIWGWLIWL